MVTVITPTCNRLESLKEAVASVYDQTYHNWEHFIVSDGYDKKVKQFVKTLRDERVKYLFTLRTKYNGNLQRNLALKYASGEYVLFLDDDNIIYRNYIEKMINGFVDEGIGYVICRIRYDGKGILDPRPPFRERTLRTPLAKACSFPRSRLYTESIRSASPWSLCLSTMASTRKERIFRGMRRL